MRGSSSGGYYGIIDLPSFGVVLIGDSINTNIAYTSDGVSYSTISPPVNAVSDFAYSPTLDMVVGVGASGAIISSSDVTNTQSWLARTSPLTRNWSAVEWITDTSRANGGYFLVVSSDSDASDECMLTSDDGITFTSVTTKAGQWEDVTYSEKLNMVVIANGKSSITNALTRGPDY